MSTIVIDIILAIFSVFLGGAIASIGWAFKLINKNDKTQAVIASKVKALEKDTDSSELSIATHNNRIVRLETKAEVVDSNITELKINLKEIAEKTLTSNKELSDKIERFLLNKDRPHGT
jgi:hypothetical protein